MKFLELVRLCYGLTVMIFPGPALAQVSSDAEDASAKKVLRVLGARHVVQAVFTFGRGQRWHSVGAIVDLLHALTAAAFAVTHPKWRGAAAVSSLVSLTFAAGETH